MLQKFILICPLRHQIAEGYLRNVRRAITHTIVGGEAATERKVSLPPCVVLLPPFFAIEEQVRELTFGLKILSALFEEMRERGSRISVRGLFVLKKKDEDVLVSRASYPAHIQRALESAFEYLPSAIQLAHTAPGGLWAPHVKLLEGVGIGSILSGTPSVDFNAVVDEAVALPCLMVKKEGVWTEYQIK
ncbi:MAG: hypothetical protein KBC21_00875 [Candidatus Pacebacteria bacterium]|nr:hypothetical protein [Candidatus Paceibacterota bacterium]